VHIQRFDLVLLANAAQTVVEVVDAGWGAVQRNARA